jgi:hypothetical protein
VQNCNLFGEKKNEREKKMVEGCTKYLPAAGRQSTMYQEAARSKSREIA